MLLVDFEIRNLALRHGMIAPFTEGVAGENVISYGLTTAGYDLRLGRDYWVFKNTFGEVVNPKKFKDQAYLSHCFDFINNADGMIIPPGGYVLAKTLEYLRIPTDVKGRCVGKSTWARCGLIVNTTPAEPGWDGILTIEIANHNPCPVMLFSGEGIAQMEFEVLNNRPEKHYGNKHDGKPGKYQSQTDVTPSRVL
jgi:dCTP deaminase